MKDLHLTLTEVQKVPFGPLTSDIIQQAVTAWLTAQLNTPHT